MLDYYKVEAVSYLGHQITAADLEIAQYRLSPKSSASSLPNYSESNPHRSNGIALMYRMIVSIDGEQVPFEPFQAEVHPGLGRVLSLRDGWYLPPQWTGS